MIPFGYRGFEREVPALRQLLAVVRPPGLALAMLAAAFSAAYAQADGYRSGGSIYRALREAPAQTIDLGDGRIDIVFAGGTPGLDRQPVLDWVRRGASAIRTYFGRFPVPRLPLLILTDDSDSIHGGVTFGFDGPAIRITVGRQARAEAFAKDWVLVHEMVHAAMPSVPQQSAWVMEGEAVYIEPIARAQAGQIDPREVWQWSLDGMPKGQPQPGDLGLDRTHSWGRTYWGGAAFWLLAEVEIRERSQGRVGLQAAFGAINRESGGNTVEWTVEHMMAVGDTATGGHELSALYAKMKNAPERVDLDGIFGKLGVGMQGGTVVLDDSAPLASLRRLITVPPPA